MINFVFFDVGGVAILDLSEEQKWNKFKKDIGLDMNMYDDFDIFWDEADRKLNIDTKVDDLIPELVSKFNLQFPDGFSLQEEFVKRFAKNESIWLVMEKVRSKYRTGLLTNMYPGMLNAIKNSGIMPPFEWEVIVDSSIMKAQKPDPQMYEIAAKMANTKANEILFIDNSKRNVWGAQQAGWQSIRYDPSNTEESNKQILEFLNNQ